jgi:coenzyme Q-binding protein COQ10
MPAYRTQRIVGHTPQQMFELVADVERYPEFLPFCTGLTVRGREPSPDGETILATMSVGYKAIRESFTSRVRLDPGAMKIHVAYVDGPFRHLSNVWRFSPAGIGCRIDFFIDYEFRSRLLAVVMGAMFDQAFRRFAAAFEERAIAVYGPIAARGPAEA